MSDYGDVVLTRDELVLAERSLAVLQQELADRVADVQALDGVFQLAWTQLTGTREARVEAAVQAVRVAEQRLARVRAQVDEARARLADHEDALERAPREARERAEALDARARELAAGGGEAAAAIGALVLERDLLRERRAALAEASAAGTALRAALATVSRASERSGRPTAFERGLVDPAGPRGDGDLIGLFAAIGRHVGARFDAAEGAAAAGPAAERFEAALAAIGGTFGERLGAGGFLDLDGAADDAGSLAVRVESLLVAIDREGRELDGALRELDHTLADAVARDP